MQLKYLGTKIIPDLEGIFIERPNRFLAKVKISNKKEKIILAHVHDSGRITNVLVKGVRVLLKKVNNPKRKTQYDILFALHKNYWVLINTKYHPLLAREILSKHIFSSDLKQILSEQFFYGESRLDFVVKHKHGKITFIEVKGCTLEENGKALFPDAPTKRGQKHLKTLLKLKKENEENDIMLLFLVFHPYTKCFAPNFSIDPQFAELFYQALKYGLIVKPVVLGYDYYKKTFFIKKTLPICQETS